MSVTNNVPRLIEFSSHKTDSPDGAGSRALPAGGSPDSTASGTGFAGEAARQTVRTLFDEVSDQIKSGEAVDLKAAAQAGIQHTLQDMATEGVDAATRALINSIPEEDPRFEASVYYNVYVSPKTRVFTPWLAAKNIQAFFEEWVGNPISQFMDEVTSSTQNTSGDQQ